jgi:hypothetical protein
MYMFTASLLRIGFEPYLPVVNKEWVRKGGKEGGK